MTRLLHNLNMTFDSGQVRSGVEYIYEHCLYLYTSTGVIITFSKKLQGTIPLGQSKFHFKQKKKIAFTL